MSRIFTPQHSLKVNDFCKLLIINCNLPNCDNKFVNVTIEGQQIILETPKFSKHFKAVMTIPDYCNILPDSKQEKRTGQLFNLTYKVELDATKMPQIEAQPEIKIQESEMLAIDQATKTGVPAVVKPVVIESRSKGKFTTQPLQKTRVLSNMTNKKLKTESEVLNKIADEAIKKESSKRSAKLETIDHKEKQISQQLEAREARKSAKRTQARNKKDNMLKQE